MLRQSAEHPRLTIHYPAVTPAGIVPRELPFVIGVLTDLSGQSVASSPFRDYSPLIPLTETNFDELMAAIHPRVMLPDLGGPAPLELRFRCRADFAPAGLLRQCAALGLSAQQAAKLLPHVLRDRSFQQLERTWLGLHHLAVNTNELPQVKVRVLNAPMAQIRRDLQRAPAVNQSLLFKYLHDDVFGCLNSEPISVLLCDHAFGGEPDDFDLLTDLARIAEQIHAPLIASAHPRIFGCESFAGVAAKSWRELQVLPDLEPTRKWQAFRNTSAAGFCCLAVPQLLLRGPHQTDELGEEWEQDTIGDDLWGGAGTALAVLLARAFDRDGWCGAFEGSERGRVDRYPTRLLKDWDGKLIPCSTDVKFDDQQEPMLTRHGLVCLMAARDGDAVCFSAYTCHRADSREDPAAFYPTLLRYWLALARFTQLLWLIHNERLSQWRSAEEWERVMNGWLDQYVQQEAVPAGTRPARPMREARIVLEAIPDPAEQSGGLARYQAVAYLRPHYTGVIDPGVALRAVVGPVSFPA